MGADEGVLLTDKAFEDGDHASPPLRALAAAIQKLDPFDLVLCGRQAVDWDMGVVGSILAELLGLPCVTRPVTSRCSDGKADGGAHPYGRHRDGGGAAARPGHRQQ